MRVWCGAEVLFVIQARDSYNILIGYYHMIPLVNYII